MTSLNHLIAKALHWTGIMKKQLSWLEIIPNWPGEVILRLGFSDGKVSEVLERE